MKDSQNKLYYLLSKTNKTTKHTLPVLFRYANSDTKKPTNPILNSAWNPELQQLSRKNIKCIQTLHSRQTTQNSKIHETKLSSLAWLMLTLSWVFSNPTASFSDERKWWFVGLRSPPSPTRQKVITQLFLVQFLHLFSRSFMDSL